MKPSRYLLLVLLFKCFLESLTSLPRAAKSLLPSLPPPLQLFGGHHLPSLHLSCPWVHSLVCTRYITTAERCWGHLRGWAQGFFSWLASGLKYTLRLFSAGKGDEHNIPSCLPTPPPGWHIISHARRFKPDPQPTLSPSYAQNHSEESPKVM